MAKTIKFSLRLDDKPIRDIKGLQENFCIDDILEFYDNGLLQKWLKVRGFDDYLKKVEAIKDDDSVIIQLINIFEIEKSEKEIMEATYSLRYWEERKLELEEWNKKDTKVKQIIADYHNGYDVLKAEIEEKKEDMPFLKTAAKEIFDTYLGIFEIDFRYFYDNYIESVPLMILAVLMNKNLRDIYLKDTYIKNDLKRFQYSSVEKQKSSPHKQVQNDVNISQNFSVENLKSSPHKHVFQRNPDGNCKKVCDEPVLVLSVTGGRHAWVNYQQSYNGSIKATHAIGKTFNKLYFQAYAASDKVEYIKLSDIGSDSDKVKDVKLSDVPSNKYDNLKSILQFQGKTDGYWKDLEVESTKVMVLSIPAGTFIRNANKPKEELSADDVNGKFLILDGLLYKSNIDNTPIVYMEV